MIQKKVIAGNVKDYPAIVSFNERYNWSLEVTLDLLLEVMRDVKIHIQFNISENDFLEHVSVIISDVADMAGLDIDCYQLLDEIADAAIALCKKYKDVGIFKELGNDGDWSYTGHYISSRKIILLVED